MTILNNLRTSHLHSQKMRITQKINLARTVLKRKIRRKNKNLTKSSLLKISNRLIKFKASSKKIKAKLHQKNKLNKQIKGNRSLKRMKLNYNLDNKRILRCNLTKINKIVKKKGKVIMNNLTQMILKRIRNLQKMIKNRMKNKRKMFKKIKKNH